MAVTVPGLPMHRPRRPVYARGSRSSRRSPGPSVACFGEPVREGVLALGVSSTEVAAVGLVALAGGSTALAVGVLTGSLVVSALAGPPLLSLLAGGTDVAVAELVGRFALVVLLPLAAGLSLRGFAPRLEEAERRACSARRPDPRGASLRGDERRRRGRLRRQRSLTGEPRLPRSDLALSYASSASRRAGADSVVLVRVRIGERRGSTLDLKCAST